MSHVGPSYGSLAANQAKIAAKRDPNLDREAQEWVEAVIGEKFPSGSYEDALKDGVILCKLMNKLQPGAIPKYATSGGAFKLRENISLFQNAARSYGLGDAELFQTIDLFEKHNIPQVTQCIFALGRNAQKKKFNGPTLGPKMSDANVREFSEEQLRAGQASLGLLTEGMSKGASEASESISSTASNPSATDKFLQIPSNSHGRPARSETLSASSEMSESSILFNDYHRSHSQRRLSQRKLSSSSVNNLLINLQNIRLPLASSHAYTDDSQRQQDEDDDDDDGNHLQLLIDLARDADSSRLDKLQRLHASLEDSIGMVELLSLLRFLKSSPSEVNINEPPLNLYASIIPTLSALLLLENDI